MFLIRVSLNSKTLVADLLVANKERYLSEVSNESEQANLIIDLLYCFVSNRPKPDFRKQTTQKENLEKVMTEYEYDLADLTQF